MNVSAHRAFSLLRELAYERLSGSAAEQQAAERLLQEALSTGAEAHIEEFTVPCGRVNHAKLIVTAPYNKEYEVTGYERAQSTPEGGLDGEFYYAENLEPAHLQHIRGKIVMINGRLRQKDYEKLQKNGAAAILSFSGTTLDKLRETDCDIRKLRETMTEAYGPAVALNLRAADAAEIVRRGATHMHIELSSESYEATSRNVCAVIEGTEHPDEIISFGAHFDSVHFSTGVYDNMSGSVIIMELLRYFAAHRPARTVQFIWYGSEEQGLLGSKAWVKAHEDELSKHVLMLNIDVAAATLGRNVAPVLATEAVVGYVDAMMKEAGFACETRLDIYSSDCIPFADHGVPAINLCRFGVQGANYIHDRRDNLKSNYIDEKSLDITLQQALYLAKRVVNASVFPIERKINDDIRKKVDDYLLKSPKKD
ncbi:MAG: M28 family peptidase [Christensenellaceae bacterium]|nr:M28 family peptidase [Christensenellaceae bacterium]